MAGYVPVDLVEVRVWGRQVGVVVPDPALGVYAFQYFPAWVSSGTQLSPLVVPNAPDPYVFPGLDRLTYYGLPEGSQHR